MTPLNKSVHFPKLQGFYSKHHACLLHYPTSPLSIYNNVCVCVFVIQDFIHWNMKLRQKSVDFFNPSSSRQTMDTKFNTWKKILNAFFL